MKTDEAIYLFKERLAVIDDLSEENKAAKVLSDYRQALIMGVDALKKQIPKKVQIYSAHPKDIVMCPLCKSTFTEHSYCGYCGQKLDKNE